MEDNQKPHRLYTLLQDDITTICNWVADNHLVLNLAKCCYIAADYAYIRFSYVLVTPTPLPELITIKTLESLLTPDLSWSLHITNICKKTVKLVYHRRRNRGGGGGHRGHVPPPPMFHKLLYKLLTTLCVVSDCAPPIKKSFLHLCLLYRNFYRFADSLNYTLH